MLPLPRVLVIDDEKKHSDAIADALRRVGIECVPAQYDEENPGSLYPALRGVRILLSDLHLIPGTQTANITQTCQPLVELITDGIPERTPFALVLWTAHPEELADVRLHLAARLPATHQPLCVHALNKMDHMSSGDSVDDADKLATALRARLREAPAVAALLEWEEMLTKATRSAVDELHRMVTELREGIDYKIALAKLLAQFATCALGKANVAQRPAAGLSEVLMPFVADALSVNVAFANQDLWNSTLQAGNGLLPNAAGRMNGRLHIGAPTDHGVQVTLKEPGAVVELPTAFLEEPQFSSRFGQIWADVKRSVLRNVQTISNFPCKPVLVRVEAACDHAQGRPGPLLFALGVLITATDKKNGSMPEMWWTSPPLQRTEIPALATTDKLLLVNTRALFIPIGNELNEAIILFRLRPSISSTLSFHFGTRAIRPGIIEFH